MYKEVHEKLFKWYKANGRHTLPWRLTDDAYKIWVSEIMLQQTQVKMVLDRFYFPFLRAFPILEDLAKASEDAVLKQWEGLGYYTRARNLHKTAQICQTSLPKEVEELNALPGIGKSTAHAIAAFAYKTPVAILDANVKRILYRVFGAKKASEKELWHFAEALFDATRPFEYNQAMMDIGSTVCTKSSPLCEECPFNTVCLASKDDPTLYPTKKPKKKVPLKEVNLLIYEFKGKLGMFQRETRFLQGLWGFEQLPREEKINGKKLGSVKHQYSHFHVEADVYLVKERCNKKTWFTPREIKAVGISKVDEKALKLLAQQY